MGAETYRVWLVSAGEPLPIDGAARLFRVGQLAKALEKRGHHVVWWTSTFNHARRRHRFAHDRTIDLGPRVELRLIHAPAYEKGVSVARFINHQVLGYEFAKAASSAPPPDVVLACLPTLELARAATKYGRERNVPVVVDIRDQWPDILLERIPLWLHLPARLALAPLARDRTNACRDATSIVGITPAFVDWGLSYAGRSATALDRDFPLAYTAERPGEEAIRTAENFWHEQGLGAEKSRFVVCFFGTMNGRHCRLEDIISAARELEKVDHRFLFVLCGTGPEREAFKSMAEGLQTVMFPGWIGAPEIWTLMRRSSVGMIPYSTQQFFLDSIPNKAAEYLSASLPVITTLHGVLGQMLAHHDCGLTYDLHNPKRLAEILRSLAKDSERLATMRANARVLYQDRFVAERVYRRMSQYLEELAVRRRAPGEVPGRMYGRAKGAATG